MRNISFSATTEKFRARRKHITRRLRWLNLKPGDQLMGCEKVQGIKKGELVRMGAITVLEVNREPLTDIIRYPFRNIPIEIDKLYHGYFYATEIVLEGFPQYYDYPQGFIDMFCEMNKCEPKTEITRILFDYMEDKATTAQARK